MAEGRGGRRGGERGYVDGGRKGLNGVVKRRPYWRERSKERLWKREIQKMEKKEGWKRWEGKERKSMWKRT